ncbi:MAG: branched-chain amino acid aminotransferase [Gammaproteobacteria bacterium]|nr:branched-chain amino acid aminotransferase [Gammaproteobacteria bacterium]NNF61216.1 branched-chain amino acid aminotransferase [Gammaproteobacteria bacterium]NNM20802.1 branched-chain amino acid aminotransferase [Gammaproteobacteria bacterium]
MAASKFGSQFAARFAHSSYADGSWLPAQIEPVATLSLHPAAHVLHYASTCFEGLKAYRHADGSVHLFRLDRHVARMQRSAELLCLPVPPADHLASMIAGLVDKVRDEVPDYPSALYLRPVLVGVDPNIGSAAHPTRDALLYVLASPVGSYFAKGASTLRLLVETEHMRTTPEFGEVKTGGNYAAGLRRVVDARAAHGVDQVLFCPGGDVQETAAANFLLLNDKKVVTKRLDGSILPGITRASVLKLAGQAGYQVEERDIEVAEMLEWVKTGEAALSGTAAVLTPVGALVHDGREHPVGDGQAGRNTQRLCEVLMAIHGGRAADTHGWLTRV